MELAARELQVRWLWQDQLLAVQQLARGALRIGPGTGCDVLPELRAPLELARWDQDAWTVCVPAGTRAAVDEGDGPQSVGQPRLASELQLGERERATLHFGAVRAELAWADRPRRVDGGWRERLDLRFLYLLVLTAFAFGVVVITSTLSAPGDDDVEVSLLRTPIHIGTLVKPPSPPVAHRPTATEPVALRPAPAALHKPTPAAASGAGHRGRGTPADLVQTMLGGSVLRGMLGTEGLGAGLAQALTGVGRGQSGVATGIDGLDLRGGPPSGPGGNSIGIGALRAGHGPDYGPGAICKGLHCKDEIGPSFGGDRVVITGSMDRDLIRAVIHRNRAQIRYCYESALIGAPKLAGRAEVHFVIGAEGNVLRAEIASSTTHAPELDACLVSRFRSWVFPKPKGGGIVEVTYPVVLQRSGSLITD